MLMSAFQMQIHIGTGPMSHVDVSYTGCFTDQLRERHVYYSYLICNFQNQNVGIWEAKIPILFLCISLNQSIITKKIWTF